MGERSCGNGEEFLPFRGRYLEKDEGSSVRAWACPRPGHPSTTFPLHNDPTYPRGRGQAHAVRRIPTFVCIILWIFSLYLSAFPLLLDLAMLSMLQPLLCLQYLSAT